MRSSGHVEIAVTNITRGQIISPVLIASHTARFEPLFELGLPASEELVAVAEDAVLDPLRNALMGDPEVLDVETLVGAGGTVILPGESASIVVATRGKFRFLSMAAMLVTTNDAFFALRGVRVPRHATSVHHSSAYDAGSEVNNEDCDFIPGPPCGMGKRDPEKDGYVHVHAGIHGIGSLDPSLLGPYKICRPRRH